MADEEKKSIARLRAEFAFWGYDYSHMSDDEFEEMVVAGSERLSAAMRETCISVDGLASALKAMGVG